MAHSLHIHTYISSVEEYILQSIYIKEKLSDQHRVAYMGASCGGRDLYPGILENNVTDLLKAFLGSGSVNTVNVQQWKMCLGGRMLLCVARQQRTNEDAG
jgi:hypothetical protein